MGRTSDTPEKLKIALSELMLEHSYGAVTIDAICVRAGVNKGSFYHFYKKKADLAIEAFEHLWETEGRPWMDNAFSPSEKPLDRIRNWLKCGFEHTRADIAKHGKILGCPFYNVGSEISTLEPLLAVKIIEILDLHQNYIGSALREAVEAGIVEIDDVDVVALDVFTLVEGAITRARITNDPAPLNSLPVSIGRLIGTDLGEITYLTK
jgi:TetR/AcrR family transcriptional repressor of nem operon